MIINFKDKFNLKDLTKFGFVEIGKGNTLIYIKFIESEILNCTSIQDFPEVKTKQIPLFIVTGIDRKLHVLDYKEILHYELTVYDYLSYWAKAGIIEYAI